MKLKDYLQGRMPKEKDLTAPMSSERADAYDRGYNAAILELGEIEIDLPQTPIKKWGDYCGESGKLPQTRLDESLLDSKEFYDLMQIYRHMPVEKQDAVCKAYDDVKKYIQRFFKPVKEELDDEALAEIRDCINHYVDQSNSNDVDRIMTLISKFSLTYKPICKTCHGVGDVTKFSGQTPETYSEEAVLCPDCFPPKQEVPSVEDIAKTIYENDMGNMKWSNAGILSKNGCLKIATAIHDMLVSRKG